MQKIISQSDLKNAILQLESQRKDQEKMLREQFNQTIDSMRPINLIKSTFKEAVASRDLKGDILSASVGLTAGYLSKIAFAGVMKSPLKRIIGTALMFGISKVIARNPETVKALGKGFFNMIRGKQGEKNPGSDFIEIRQIG